MFHHNLPENEEIIQVESLNLSRLMKNEIKIEEKYEKLHFGIDGVHFFKNITT